MFSLVKSKQLDLRTLKSSPRFFSQRTWDEAKEGDFLFGFEPHVRIFLFFFLKIIKFHFVFFFSNSLKKI